MPVSRMRTHAAAIAWAAVIGSLMTVMADGQTAPKGTGTIIEQAGYFALPGNAEEVYQARIQACDVLEKLGLPRGVVFFVAREARTPFPTSCGRSNSPTMPRVSAI
jgi:hypothetical protein